MAQTISPEPAELLATLEGIPSFPPIAVRLVQSLSDETIDVKNLVELIRADPKLTAALVRRANSPAYGFVREVDSVQDALVLLGFDTVRVMALTLAAGTYTQATLKTPELRRCWTHSLATAFLAEELARFTALRPDQAYTAGLLHDLGRLGLLVAYPEPYAELLREEQSEEPKDDSTYLLDRERRRFGIDHCEAGLLLAQRWGFPEELTRIAGRHHDRSDEGVLDLLKITHAACRLADTFDFDVIQTTMPFTREEALGIFPAREVDTIWKRIDVLKQRVQDKVNAIDGGVGEPAEEREPLMEESPSIVVASPRNAVALPEPIEPSPPAPILPTTAASPPPSAETSFSPMLLGIAAFVFTALAILLLQSFY